MMMKISVVGCKVVKWSSLVGGYNMSSGIWLLPSSWKSVFWLHVDSLCALLRASDGDRSLGNVANQLPGYAPSIIGRPQF